MEVDTLDRNKHYEEWLSQPVVVLLRPEQEEVAKKKVADVTVEELTEIITRSILANQNVPRYEERNSKVGKALDTVNDIGHAVVDVAESAVRRLLDTVTWRRKL